MKIRQKNLLHIILCSLPFKQLGLPILENGRSLGIKRFFIDNELKIKYLNMLKDKPNIFNRNWFIILKE